MKKFHYATLAIAGVMILSALLGTRRSTISSSELVKTTNVIETTFNFEVSK